MALQSSGQISLANIATEKGTPLSNVSLNTLSTTGINQYSVAQPDGAQPHSISEFYGYDHNASPPVSLSPVNASGPWPDTDFACNEGPSAPPHQYYYSGGEFGIGSTVYFDDSGAETVEPNTAWYNFDNGQSFQLDDSSTVVFQALCGGKPPKG